MKIFRSLVLMLGALAGASLAQNKLLTVDDIFSPDPNVRVPFGGSLGRPAWTGGRKRGV